MSIDWRALPEADWFFVQKLHEIDPKLNCYLNVNIERYVITYDRPAGPPVPILTIETEDRQFRKPDDRDIKAVQQGDMHSDRNKNYLQKVAKHMEEARAKSRATARDNINHMTRADRRSLMTRYNRAYGSGKGNSTFRRVEHKVRGEVF